MRVASVASRSVRGSGKSPTFYERFAEAFQLEAQAFVDAVLGDRPLPLTLRDATEATRIGIALTQSLRSGRAVDVE